MSRTIMFIFIERILVFLVSKENAIFSQFRLQNSIRCCTKDPDGDWVLPDEERHVEAEWGEETDVQQYDHYQVPSKERHS